MRKSFIGRVAAVAAASIVLAACSGGGDGASTSSPDGGATDGATDETSQEAGEGGDDGAAGGDVSGEISFTWWGNDDRADRYNEALELFHDKYPDITVTTSWQAFPDYWTARNTEAAGSALPDVMQFDSAYLREYASSDRLLDLHSFVEDGTIDLSGFDSSLVGSGELEGVQVAIPTSTNTLAMFLSPDVIDEIGIPFPDEGYTYEDLNEWMLAVSAADVTNAEGYKLYGSGDYTATFWFFLQYLVQKGEAPFTEDGELNFGKDEILEWLNVAKPVRDAQAQFPVERGVALSPLGGFTVNEVGAEASWSNFLAGYEADSGKENLEMVSIPSGPDGTKNFFRPSMLLAAGANSANPEAAATLINFLLTDPEVGTIFGTSKGVPADSAQRAAVDADPESVDGKVLAYEEFIATTDTATAPIPVRGFGSIEEKWRNLGEELNYASISEEQFADEWLAEAAIVMGN